jgi:hypothetical protein
METSFFGTGHSTPTDLRISQGHEQNQRSWLAQINTMASILIDTLRKFCITVS